MQNPLLLCYMLLSSVGMMYIMSHNPSLHDYNIISGFELSQQNVTTIISGFELSQENITTIISGLQYQPQYIARVTDLVNHYSYKKHMINFDRNTVADFVQLPQQYTKCFKNIEQNNHCQLPRNISLFINNKLAFGYQSNIYNITVMENHTKNTELYVLKIYHRESYGKEYDLFTKIRKYIKYFNLSYDSLAIPFLHPSIPGYQLSEQYSLLINKQIKNAMTWNETLIKAEILLPSLLLTKGNIMNFLIDCYKDIMNIMQIFYDLNIYHNDLNSVNFLVNTVTFKCYVIDFGFIFEENNMLHPKSVINGLRLRCFAATCSPVGYYYLEKPQRRHKFQHAMYNITGNDRAKQKQVTADVTKILCKYAIYGKQYEVAVRMFHAFVRLYYIQIKQENNTLFKMNEAIIQPLNVPENYRKDIDIKYVWCSRYEMFYNVMKMVENNSSEMRLFPDDIKEDFMQMIKIIADDLLFLNDTNCPFIVKLYS